MSDGLFLLLVLLGGVGALAGIFTWWEYLHPAPGTRRNPVVVPPSAEVRDHTQQPTTDADAKRLFAQATAPGRERYATWVVAGCSLAGWFASILLFDQHQRVHQLVCTAAGALVGLVLGSSLRRRLRAQEAAEWRRRRGIEGREL